MAFIQSGTGERLTAEEIRERGTFPQGTFFVDENTGQKIELDDMPGVSASEQEEDDGGFTKEEKTPGANTESAQQIIEDNPNLGRNELINKVTDETNLSVGQATSLVEANQEQTDTSGGQNQQDTSSQTNITNVPSFIKNDENLFSQFKNLPKDQQKVLSAVANTIATQNQQEKQTLDQALEKAKKQADAFFKEKIRLIQDELKRSFGEFEESLEKKRARIEDRISEINKDLREKKDRLSIDKQAELAKEKRRKRRRLRKIDSRMRERGLTFSSKRRKAKRRAKARSKGIIESTKREFNRERRDAITRAQRKKEKLRNELSDTEESVRQRAEDLLREKEKKIGSKNLPSGLSLSGLDVEKFGDVSGTFKESKTADIINRASALSSLGNSSIEDVTS